MPKRGYILVLMLAVMWHSRPRLCSAEDGRAIPKAFDLRSNTAEGGCATVPPGAADFGSAMRAIAGASAQSAKPWVLDPVAFRNAHGNRSWIIGRSDRPAMSDSEAIELAHADAARQLSSVMMSRVNAWPGDRRWLESRIDSQVASGRLDADTCLERFDRPYGSVYAGSVLLDVSADRMESVIRDAKFELTARHRKAALRVAIAGALLTFTWLGYALLNSITRGYVTGRLRWIAAAIAIGILLMV
jgi:hypothetical protein